MNDINGFAAWLQEQEMSESTIDLYVFTAKEFFSKYTELTKTNLIEYKQWLIKNRAPRTAAIRCVAINRFLAYIGKPELSLKTVKIKKTLSLENVISEDEYRKLLEELKRDKNCEGLWTVVFLAKTGARASELAKFTKKDLERGYCEMWTKGKIRRIYIPENICTESQEYFKNKDGEFLFTSQCNGFKGRPLSQRSLDARLKSYAEKYGIRREVMHAHSFRHFFAIEFLKRNNNIALLADLMGHESVDTTAIYLRLTAEEQAAALNAAMNW